MLPRLLPPFSPLLLALIACGTAMPEAPPALEGVARGPAPWPGSALPPPVSAAPWAAAGHAAPAPKTLDARGTFLRPNVWIDGRPAFVHVTPADMPWRVSVGLPPEPPRRGSRHEARTAAIEGMRLWEQALRPHLPWFRLEVAAWDPEAPVQLRWRRRLPGSSWGWGQIQWWSLGDELRVGGLIQVSTTPRPRVRLSAWDLRRIVAHEFGHVLGLGHCLDCDSIMNYATDPVREPRVTDTDVRTLLALLERPNGRPDR